MESFRSACAVAFVLVVVNGLSSSAQAHDDQFSEADDRIPAAITAEPRRPALLIPLYVSFASLQALDVHSTVKVLRNGGREANPIAAQFVHSPVAFVVVKMGAAAAATIASERLFKHHPKAAVLMMVAANAGVAIAAAHNYSVLRARPQGR